MVRNFAEKVKTEYKEDQFVNIGKSQGNYEANMNLKSKRAENFVGELN